MIAQTIKSADWKSEKHVPVITLSEGAKPGEAFDAEVTVGKEIPHPNTPAHHISWIALHFVPAGGSTSIELGRAWFTAHGDSMDSANELFYIFQAFFKAKAFYSSERNKNHRIFALF